MQDRVHEQHLSSCACAHASESESESEREREKEERDRDRKGERTLTYTIHTHYTHKSHWTTPSTFPLNNLSLTPIKAYKRRGTARETEKEPWKSEERVEGAVVSY